MSYAQYGTIQATDFNTLVGTNPGSTANCLNTTWATGSGNVGYGQTAVAQVSSGQVISASGQWGTLVANTSSAASHQGSSITSVVAPVTGGDILFQSAVQTNLQTIYSNRLNAVSQSSTTANSVTTVSTWSQIATFTQTATFANGDAARYFFNAGGQLAITCSHPNGTGINLLLNNLASNVGTIVLSSPTSGSASIAGTSYNGVTKIGGGGNAPTIAATSGYYAWTTANATVFTQTASTGPYTYYPTNISVLVKTNGTQGSNGDKGSVITVYTVWDEIPDGLVVASGSVNTLTVRYPETTNIANTWGTVTLTGSVSSI